MTKCDQPHQSDNRLVNPVPEPSTNGAPVTIETDVGFHLLQNSRRRAVLRYLLDYDEAVAPIDDVTDQVAAWENETPVAEIPAESRKRVYTSLHHIHLPKLAKEGVINYDRTQGAIVGTPLVAIFAPYLADEFHPNTVLMLDSDPDE